MLNGVDVFGVSGTLEAISVYPVLALLSEMPGKVAMPATAATVVVPDAPGFQNYFVSFASFSNSSVFTALTSLSIKATFPNVTGSGPSLTINSPIVIAAIPEPSVLALGSVACLVFGGLRLRRKSQS